MGRGGRSVDSSGGSGGQNDEWFGWWWIVEGDVANGKLFLGNPWFDFEIPARSFLAFAKLDCAPRPSSLAKQAHPDTMHQTAGECVPTRPCNLPLTFLTYRLQYA